MTTRRAGAFPPVPPGGIILVDVTDDLLRQLGRVVLVDESNVQLAGVNWLGGPFVGSRSPAMVLMSPATQAAASFVGARLDIHLGSWLGSVAPTVGQKVAASSLPVVLASDGIPNINISSWLASGAPTVGQKVMASSIPVVIASDQLTPTPSPLAVVVAGGANAIATLTLPAAGVGLFHYITYLSIWRVATAALAGGALLTVTSTNLPGAPTWRTGNTMAIVAPATGFVVLTDQAFSSPLKSSVANTATTIVAPAAGAAVSWHMRAHYYTGP